MIILTMCLGVWVLNGITTRKGLEVRWIMVILCARTLTELIAELLELADEKKLPFNTAVEVSYLRSEEQQILLQYMSNHNMVPSMKQAKELKQISKERMLTYSEIDQICMNESTEKVQVQIPAKKLKQYFPESYSKAQIEEVIFMLLASWAEKQ